MFVWTLRSYLIGPGTVCYSFNHRTSTCVALITHLLSIHSAVSVQVYDGVSAVQMYTYVALVNVFLFGGVGLVKFILDFTARKDLRNYVFPFLVCRNFLVVVADTPEAGTITTIRSS